MTTPSLTTTLNSNVNQKTSNPTQNDLLCTNLLKYFDNHPENLNKMLKIITGETMISLRIIDWFTTNYAKKYYTLYTLHGDDNKRFKVYFDYKLKLKAYSKKRFDPFCRRERINIPYIDGTSMETTIGQLNFFRWALENKVIDYIEAHYKEIENDMNMRNSLTKKKTSIVLTDDGQNQSDQNKKTRKKREELSISAIQSIKKEEVVIVVEFN